jgi:hypothetical protein
VRVPAVSLARLLVDPYRDLAEIPAPTVPARALVVAAITLLSTMKARSNTRTNTALVTPTSMVGVSVLMCVLANLLEHGPPKSIGADKKNGQRVEVGICQARRKQRGGEGAQFRFVAQQL